MEYEKWALEIAGILRWRREIDKRRPKKEGVQKGP